MQNYYSEYKYFIIRTDQFGTWILPNPERYELPDDYPRVFYTDSKGDLNFIEEMNKTYNTNEWQETFKVATWLDIKNDLPKEFVMTTHDTLHKLFGDEVKWWVIKNFKEFEFILPEEYSI